MYDKSVIYNYMRGTNMNIPYNISREDLRNITFGKYLPEHCGEVFRMSGAERNRLCSDFSERRNILFKHLNDIFIRKAGDAPNTAVYIGTRCDINESTFRKTIYNRTRTLTEEFIGKICVGLQLSIEESKELFEEFGAPLVWGQSAFATVTLRALKEGDGIDDYSEDLEYLKNEKVL